MLDTKRRAFIFSECFFDERQKPDCPAVDRGIVDKGATFLHQLFEIAVAEWVSCIPNAFFGVCLGASALPTNLTKRGQIVGKTASECELPTEWWV